MFVVMNDVVLMLDACVVLCCVVWSGVRLIKKLVRQVCEITHAHTHIRQRNAKRAKINRSAKGKRERDAETLNSSSKLKTISASSCVSILLLFCRVGSDEVISSGRSQFDLDSSH